MHIRPLTHNELFLLGSIHYMLCSPGKAIKLYSIVVFRVNLAHTSNSRVFKTLNFVAVFKHLLCFKYWLAVIVNTDCNMFYLDAQEDRDVYGLAKRDNSQIDIFSSLTGDSPKMQVKKKSSTIFLPYCLSTDPAILKKPNKVICINWFIKYGVRNPNNVTCTYFYQLFWYSLVF